VSLTSCCRRLATSFALVLAASSSHSATYTQRCAALVESLGGRNPVTFYRAQKTEDLRTLSRHFSNTKSATRLQAILELTESHVQEVYADFLEWNHGSGIEAKIKYERTEWADESGTEHQISSPYIEFSLASAGRTADFQYSTLVGPLLLHRLTVSRETRFIYHPLVLYVNKAMGVFSGILDRGLPTVYLGVEDLYAFDLLPEPFLHELTHLNKLEQLLRWKKKKTSSRFFASGASVIMNVAAAKKFENSYFKSLGLTSVDEARAYLGSVQVRRKNLRKMIAESQLPRQVIQNEIRGFLELCSSVYILNDEVGRAIRLFLVSIKNGDRGLGFFQQNFFSTDTMTIQRYEHGQSAVMELYLPAKFSADRETDHSINRFYFKMRQQGAKIADMPEVLRTDLIESLESQSKYHEAVMIKLLQIHSSQEVKAWAAQFY
jgi:hypothetical protein